MKGIWQGFLATVEQFQRLGFSDQTQREKLDYFASEAEKKIRKDVPDGKPIHIMYKKNWDGSNFIEIIKGRYGESRTVLLPHSYFGHKVGVEIAKLLKL